MSLVLPNDPRSPFWRAHNWYRIKNSASEVIQPFSVVLINGIVSTTNEIVYSVIKPNSASTDFNWDGYLVTWPFAINNTNPVNEGYATCLTDPGFVRYDASGTPAIKEKWGPKHNQYTLSKNYYGFEILGGNTSYNGISVTVARWVGIPYVLGKIDGSSVTLGGTCTVSVWDQARSADTTMNLTSVMNNAVALTSSTNKACGVGPAGTTGELIWAAC